MKKEIKDFYSQIYALARTNPIFFCTNSTGDTLADEACELCVIDFNGKVLFNKKMNPTLYYYNDKSIIEYYEELKDLFSKNIAISFNLKFHYSMLYQACYYHGLVDNIFDKISYNSLFDLKVIGKNFYNKVMAKANEKIDYDIYLFDLVELFMIQWPKDLSGIHEQTELIRLCFLHMCHH